MSAFRIIEAFNVVEHVSLGLVARAIGLRRKRGGPTLRKSRNPKRGEGTQRLGPEMRRRSLWASIRVSLAQEGNICYQRIPAGFEIKVTVAGRRSPRVSFFARERYLTTIVLQLAEQDVRPAIAEP